MYSPEAFKINDEKIIEDFIAKNPFAILTSENNGKIEITHLPINRFKDGKLYGHLAKANIHADIDETTEDIEKVIQSLRNKKQTEVANFMEHITNHRKKYEY